MSFLSLFLCQSDEDEPDVDSDFDDGSFSVSDGSNRSSRPKKKPKSSKKKKKGLHGNIIKKISAGKRFIKRKAFFYIKNMMEVKAKIMTMSQSVNLIFSHFLCSLSGDGGR